MPVDQLGGQATAGEHTDEVLDTFDGSGGSVRSPLHVRHVKLVGEVREDQSGILQLDADAVDVVVSRDLEA